MTDEHGDGVVFKQSQQQAPLRQGVTHPGSSHTRDRPALDGAREGPGRPASPAGSGPALYHFA